MPEGVEVEEWGCVFEEIVLDHELDLGFEILKLKVKV